jgi:hypothetical protein
MVAHDALSPWESFYVIVGSSAAALTGLQFVVMALVSETQSRAGMHEIEAFATPNVVHFCVVLLLSAILSSPWPSLHALAVCAGIVAVAGVVYALIVARRARRTPNYSAVLEDWIFHVALPLVAHVAVLVGAFTLDASPYYTMFVFAAASLVLLFAGIHNAWDTATYIATVYRTKAPDSATTPGESSSTLTADQK